MTQQSSFEPVNMAQTHVKYVLSFYIHSVSLYQHYWNLPQRVCRDGLVFLLMKSGNLHVLLKMDVLSNHDQFLISFPLHNISYWWETQLVVVISSLAFLYLSVIRTL
jgi:hypothetical protein